MDEIIDKFSLKNSKKIKQICSPLNTHLGIDYFTYYFIREDGHFGIVSNAFEFMEYYYFQKLYLTNPYMSHPHLFHSGHSLTTCTYDEETQTQLKRQFKADSLFLTLECTPGMVEGFIFAKPNISQNELPLFVSKLDLLKKFTRYFKREAEPLLEKIEGEKYNLQKTRGEAFLEGANLPLIGVKKEDAAFLDKVWGLSPQEQKCFDLFRMGNSAQATAAKMGLSQRTVEHYLDNIKLKLGCRSKWDLLSF